MSESADSPTHDASPHKVMRARARGDVPHSPLLDGAAWFAGLACALVAVGPRFAQACVALWGGALQAVRAGAARAPDALAEPLRALLLPVAALLVLPVVSVTLAALVQSGFAWRTARSTSTFVQRAFPWLTREHFRDRLVACVWLLGVLLVGAHAVAPTLRGVLDAWQSTPAHVAAGSFTLLSSLLLRGALALALFGAADLALRFVQRRQRLRMTRRELEDERRASEGDPQLLQERQRRLRALVHEAGLAELSRACLVLHDGAEAALALRYVPSEHAAPIVWIKGRGTLALRMRELAHTHAVPMAHDPALVASLGALELTQAVPSAFHARVAQLMAASAP